MLVLGIETATLVAGVSLVSEEKVISEHFINNRKTHSQNLMPMIKEVIEEAGITPKELGGIAVSLGPGSFTGLRIGMATAKSLAQVLKVPLIGVPTLDGLANNLDGLPGIVCPILDAKKSQVYTAFYESNKEGDKLARSSDYLAITPEELIEEIKVIDKEVTFLGDAVPVFKEKLREGLGKKAHFAYKSNALPRGASIAELGLNALREGKQDNLFELQPLYIRRSEAEINWEKKNANVQEKS